MTQEEWEACRWLETAYQELQPIRKEQDRKLRLWMCACLRNQRFEVMSVEAREVIESSERYADDDELHEPLRASEVRLAFLNPVDPHVIATGAGTMRAASYRASSQEWFGRIRNLIKHRTRLRGPFDKRHDEAEAEWHEQYACLRLLRDIFGNPFRPVAFDSAWQTSSVVGLAQSMYQSRDFAAMPVLADALQDAGCEHADILDHCRDPQQVHVRGCWVVDLVLGKS